MYNQSSIEGMQTDERINVSNYLDTSVSGDSTQGKSSLSDKPIGKNKPSKSSQVDYNFYDNNRTKNNNKSRNSSKDQSKKGGISLKYCEGSFLTCPTNIGLFVVLVIIQLLPDWAMSKLKLNLQIRDAVNTVIYLLTVVLAAILTIRIINKYLGFKFLEKYQIMKQGGSRTKSKDQNKKGSKQRKALNDMIDY